MVNITTLAQAKSLVHTLNMSIFPNAVSAPKPKAKQAVSIGLVQSGIIVVIVLAQLFSFEDYLNIFASMYLANEPNSYLIASSIVAAEVFSLPFLLRLKLSPAMRVFSMLLLWVVSATWLVLSIYLPINQPGLSSTGLLGGLVNITSSQLVIFGIIFTSLTIINSWGMWPFAKHRKGFLKWKR